MSGNLRETDTIRIPSYEMFSTFLNILLKSEVQGKEAEQCTSVFVDNSLDGIHTHGVNRFPKFVMSIRNAIVRVNNKADLVSGNGSMEVWDGKSRIGIVNAIDCTERAMQLAKKHGVGCVSIRNTNHWMRAGTYARIAAARGVTLICWTNTVGNTPAWGAIDQRLGNNPIAIGVPYGDHPLILDIAMSQYSYGRLEYESKLGKKLPFVGGFDANGKLTSDPGEILDSGRVLPIGYWKGAGLSLLLDVLATILSGGLSVSEISKQSEETNVSQVFVAFDISNLNHSPMIPKLLRQIIDDYKESVVGGGQSVRYPGEHISEIRANNLKNGIPVLKSIWDKVRAL